jgi:hypothetical protein
LHRSAYQSPGRAPGRRHSFSRRGAEILLVAILVAVGGCSIPKGFDPLSSGPHLGSFIGVHFGDELPDVAAHYPQAVPETSPFGAETLRLSDVKADDVVYRTVVFEFLWHGGGMQVVMARFDPTYGKAIFSNLSTRIGPPSLAGTKGSRPLAEAQWRLPDGTSVSLNNTVGRLVIVWPSGKILTDDIRMREEKGEEFAS